MAQDPHFTVRSTSCQASGASEQTLSPYPEHEMRCLFAVAEIDFIMMMILRLWNVAILHVKVQGPHL